MSLGKSTVVGHMTLTGIANNYLTNLHHFHHQHNFFPHFFYVGIPKEDFFSGHPLSPLFQSSFVHYIYRFMPALGSCSDALPQQYTHTDYWQACTEHHPPTHPLHTNKIIINPWPLYMPYNCALFLGSLLLCWFRDTNNLSVIFKRFRVHIISLKIF